MNLFSVGFSVLNSDMNKNFAAPERPSMTV